MGVLAVTVGCRHAPPEAAAPPVAQAPPSETCILAGPRDWKPEAAWDCLVPLDEMQAWPEELVRIELEEAPNMSHEVALRITMADEWPRAIDLPWAAVVPGDVGTPNLAGSLRIHDGPDGDGRCEGKAATHGLRVWVVRGGGYVRASLPASCEQDPPAWFGDNLVSWELPRPDGQVEVLGPATMDILSASTHRPEPVDEGCEGDAFVLEDLRAADLCRVGHQEVGDFPGPEELALEAETVVGRPGERVRFEVVYRNIGDAPLTVDMFLGDSEPLGAWSFFRDGAAVEPPSGCDTAGLGMAEGRRVRLAPGGTLTMPVSTVLQPGGEWLYRSAGPECEVDLEPGDYEVEVVAPERYPGRRDRVKVQVGR